ncbi:recombinase family protein [Flaviflexus ciconiae]|uniref:recombinase family protein n=1 Tax=Flaviflexus ciconiae TaxID=2496867 RepID=UPI001D186423
MAAGSPFRGKRISRASDSPLPLRHGYLNHQSGQSSRPTFNRRTPNKLTILGAVAQLERSVIRERQMEGIALAKAAGKYDKGVRLTAEQITEARKKVDSGS